MTKIEELRFELSECARDAMKLTSDIADSEAEYTKRFKDLKEKADELYKQIDENLDKE